MPDIAKRNNHSFCTGAIPCHGKLRETLSRNVRQCPPEVLETYLQFTDRQTFISSSRSRYQSTYTMCRTPLLEINPTLDDRQNHTNEQGYEIDQHFHQDQDYEHQGLDSDEHGIEQESGHLPQTRRHPFWIHYLGGEYEKRLWDQQQEQQGNSRTTAKHIHHIFNEAEILKTNLEHLTLRGLLAWPTFTMVPILELLGSHLHRLTDLERLSLRHETLKNDSLTGLRHRFRGFIPYRWSSHIEFTTDSGAEWSQGEYNCQGERLLAPTVYTKLKMLDLHNIKVENRYFFKFLTQASGLCSLDLMDSAHVDYFDDQDSPFFYLVPKRTLHLVHLGFQAQHPRIQRLIQHYYSLLDADIITAIQLKCSALETLNPDTT
ncbi:hypothetical protein BGZ50_009052 [Haplosporangium sp. Z 11]|nr:hypothetical protein BGZ50_009052 [Haplosporangium sp. Z 11]